MLKVKLSSLLFALLVSMSSAAFAVEVKTSQTPSAVTTDVAVVSKINLNTADALTLQRGLLGIGEVKAQAIVAYREEHGNFASVDELLEVKGIGEATLEKNREKLSIN